MKTINAKNHEFELYIANPANLKKVGLNFNATLKIEDEEKYMKFLKRLKKCLKK